MAEVLDQFEFKRGGGVRYPWDEWADGKIRRLSQGKDFDAKVDSFVNSVYGRANKMGRKVRVAKVGESDVVVQFYDNGQSPSA